MPMRQHYQVQEVPRPLRRRQKVQLPDLPGHRVMGDTTITCAILRSWHARKLRSANLSAR